MLATCLAWNRDLHSSTLYGGSSGVYLDSWASDWVTNISSQVFQILFRANSLDSSYDVTMPISTTGGNCDTLATHVIICIQSQEIPKLIEFRNGYRHLKANQGSTGVINPRRVRWI